MRVPFNDLQSLHAPLLEELEAAARRVLASGRFVSGPEVESLEREILPYVGASHAVAVSSGTDAIVLALQALGVKPGDEVLTSPFTFFATTAAIVRLGAVPVYVDIDAETFNLHPERVYDYVDDGVVGGKKRTEFNSDRTKVRAILPVHLYGQCADMDPIVELADQFNLMVVEDAAQAIQSKYKDRPAGTLGDAGAFSFYPTKNLGGLGEGGLVVTEDELLADQLRQLRNHGQRESHVHEAISGNYRMDEIRAALLRVKLPHLEEWQRARREAAERYVELIRGEERLLDDVILPKVADGRTHNWHQFVLRVDRRDEVRAFLAERGVETAVYYPLPAHLQPCVKHLGYEAGDLPEAERAAQEVLSLPLYPGIREEQQAYVVEQLKEFFQKRA